MNKPILDACCGSRIFWFDPKDPRALFVDCRRMQTEAIWKSSNGRAVRYCDILPDVMADFRHLPFPDATFWHIVFDPPHLLHVGDNAWMAKKYGKLPCDWKPLIHDGFHECWRVLKPHGTLIFKWSEIQIPVREVIDCIGVLPLYGHKSGRASKTHWMAFVKLQEGEVVCPCATCPDYLGWVHIRRNDGVWVDRPWCNKHDEVAQPWNHGCKSRIIEGDSK